MIFQSFAEPLFIRTPLWKKLDKNPHFLQEKRCCENSDGGLFVLFCKTLLFTSNSRKKNSWMQQSTAAHTHMWIRLITVIGKLFSRKKITFIMQDNINNFLTTIFNFKMRIALFCQNSFLAHTQKQVGKFREKQKTNYIFPFFFI